MWPFLIPQPLGQPHSVFGCTRACWLFSCFHNPPNSDRDYRIFNVRTWLVFRMRAYTHGGWAHTDSESAPPFWHGQTQKFFLCSWRDSNPRPLDLQSNALSNHWANPSPHFRGKDGDRNPRKLEGRATLPRKFRPLRQNALYCLDILDERSPFNQFNVLCSTFRDKDGDRKSRRDKRRGSLCLSEIISASAVPHCWMQSKKWGTITTIYNTYNVLHVTVLLQPTGTFYKNIIL